MKTFFDVLQVIISLALVLFLAYYSIRVLLPRLQAGRTGYGGNLRVVERLPLGMRSNLCLVKAGEQYFLLGVTPGGMEFLAELPADAIRHGIPVEPIQFSEILQNSKARSEEMWRLLREKTGRGSQERDDEREE